VAQGSTRQKRSDGFSSGSSRKRQQRLRLAAGGPIYGADSGCEVEDRRALKGGGGTHHLLKGAHNSQSSAPLAMACEAHHDVMRE